MKNRLKLRLLKTSGFTLLELLIVMIIIGLLAALIGPKMIGRVGESRQTVAKQQIEGFSSALEMYKLDTAKYPTQEQGLEALIAQPQGVINWKGSYLKRNSSQKTRGATTIFTPIRGEHGDYDIISTAQTASLAEMVKKRTS